MKYAISAALFCLLLSAPARAQAIGGQAIGGQAIGAQAISPRNIEVGTAIVCDTQQEVERFVSLMRGSTLSANSAVNTINAEENDRNAGGESKPAFLRGASLATVRTRDETFEITEILVVGVATEAGCGRLSRAFTSRCSSWKSFPSDLCSADLLLLLQRIQPRTDTPLIR
jgi:hypothetical protein